MQQRTTVGIVGLLIALYSGVNWMGNLREAIRAQSREVWELPYLARLGANGLAQVTHPVHTGIERNQQTDNTHRGALLHGSIDGAF